MRVEKKQYYKINYAIYLLLIISPSIKSKDYLHFYRASSFWEEPRLEKQWLSSFECNVSRGSTKHSKNELQKKAELLDIYGFANMKLVGKGTDLNVNDIHDLILFNLIGLPSNGNFAKLSFSGKFSTFEADFTLSQNLINGFFTQAHIPFRKIKVQVDPFVDLSPEIGNPNKNDLNWQAFLIGFPVLLRKKNLNIDSYNRTGTGDVSWYIGWTKNYEDTQDLDFIDFTTKLGVLFATSKKKDPDHVFSLPQGYNGHKGADFTLDFAIGAYEWLTIGSHLELLHFFDHKKEMRITTDVEQSGMIKLAKDTVLFKKGSIINCGFFAKADHIIAGISLLIGYSRTHKRNDRVIPKNSNFTQINANSDQALKGWDQHTIHLKADVDFTKKTNIFGPRIGVFYNHQLSGLRTFKANMIGGNFGFEINWDY